MRNRFDVPSLIVLLIGLHGCAGTRVVEDRKSTSIFTGEPCGVRYYNPAWFVLAWVDEAGIVQCRTMLLPDLTRRMSAEPYAFLSNNEIELKFANGMLTNVNEKVDATQVPAALIKLAERAAKAYVKAQGVPTLESAQHTGSTRGIPGPYLFRLVATESEPGYALEGQGGEEINLPRSSVELSPPPLSTKPPPASQPAQGGNKK